MVTPYYAAHWMRIGVFLGFDYGVLKRIELDYSGNCRKCCDTMLAEWLEGNTAADASREKLTRSINLAISDGTSMLYI